MGFTLGKHFVDGGLEVAGYYSRHYTSAQEAAAFTETLAYEKLEDLLEACDTIFLTVPDGQIESVIRTLDTYPDLVTDKILCHTSGACSSHLFSGMSNHVYGYSIHPIYATSDKYGSYKEFHKCYITIEGDKTYEEKLVRMFEALGHNVKVIASDVKVLYHASCVMASNLVIGLYRLAVENLSACGMSRAEAEEALRPLFQNNAENLLSAGMQKALTGPVARGDVATIEGHRKVLSGISKEAYDALTASLIEMRDSYKKGGAIMTKS